MLHSIRSMSAKVNGLLQRLEDLFVGAFYLVAVNGNVAVDLLCMDGSFRASYHEQD